MNSLYKYFLTLCVVGAVLFLVPLFVEQPLGFGKDVVVEQVVMSGVAATTTGTTIPVSSYKSLGIFIGTTNVSSTIKIACSTSDTTPTFSTTTSVTNPWGFVDVTDTSNGTSIDGTTGLVFTNSTTVRFLTLTNENIFKNCTAIQSPWTAGTTTVKFTPVNNL